MLVQTASVTFPVNAAFAPYLRVKLDAGVLAAAALADRELGTLEQRVLAGDSVAAVVPRNAPGTRKMVAAAAFAANTVVFTAAGGKISSTAALGSRRVGIALEAASGDNSIVEVFNDPNEVVQ